MKKAEAVLGPMLKHLGLESGVKLQRIRNDWHSIFDKSISSHIFPAVLNEGELLLNVESPAWMQQLTYYKKEIVKKLGPYGISEIRFRLGKIPKKKQPGTEKKLARELSSEEVLFISSAVAGFSDENLKASIKKAIEKSLLADRKPSSS